MCRHVVTSRGSPGQHSPGGGRRRRRRRRGPSALRGRGTVAEEAADDHLVPGRTADVEHLQLGGAQLGDLGTEVVPHAGLHPGAVLQVNHLCGAEQQPVTEHRTISSADAENAYGTGSI